MYYSWDYLLGRWIIGRAKTHGDLVVFDRYFYDWFIHSCYERIPRWLFPFFRRVFPRPDVVVHLCNDPETVHRRKPELTVRQIEEQNRRCAGIVAVLPYAMTVVTDSGLDRTVEQIREAVVTVMRSRFQASRS
jgi:thymidylate kinase